MQILLKNDDTYDLIDTYLYAAAKDLNEGKLFDIAAEIENIRLKYRLKLNALENQPKRNLKRIK